MKTFRLGEKPRQYVEQEPKDEEMFNEEATAEEDLFQPPEFEGKVGTLPTMEWIKANFRTKSGAIRYLASQGHSTKTISQFLDVRYQHVRNVTTRELKRGPSEVFHEQHWQCSHTKEAFIDVIVRTGLRDPTSDKILYRVCIQCAYDNIPGVTRDSIAKLIPGAIVNAKPRKP